MNLTTLELRVQNTVGLAAGTAGNEQTLIRGWAIEAAIKFLQKTKAVKRTATMTLTANKEDYTLDADILAFEDLWVEPGDGSQTVMLIPMDSYDIREMRVTANAVNAPPVYYYAYEGGVLMLYPTPLSSLDELHIVYVPRPTGTFTTGSDSWSDATRGAIPEQYHDILESYVKWKAAQYSNDGPSQIGRAYKDEWEMGLVEARATENKRAGVRTAYARVGRRRNFPVRNGVDVRYH